MAAISTAKLSTLHHYLIQINSWLHPTQMRCLTKAVHNCFISTGKHFCNVDSFEFDCLYVLLILLTKDREARLVEANQQIAKQSEDRCALEQQVKNLESQR